MLPEAVLSSLLILLPVPEVDIRGDKDAEEGGGVDHLALDLRHPPLELVSLLQVPTFQVKIVCETVQEKLHELESSR